LQAFFLKKLRCISPKPINGLRSKRSRKALLLKLVLVVIDIIHGIGAILHIDNISHIVPIGILGVFISVGENLSPAFQ
jgi:hypothetical protein